jgi:uncharacterized surface anchored protein
VLKQGRRILVAVAVVAGLMVSSNAYAQSQLISGTVADQSGGMIPGASVKVIDEAKNALVREVISDDNGRFQALNIQPGSYSLTVEAPGFKKLTRSNVNLEVNTRLDVGELKLTLGEVTETVQVTDTPSLVQTNMAACIGIRCAAPVTATGMPRCPRLSRSKKT